MPIALVCCYTMDWITPQALDLASCEVSNRRGEARGQKKGESDIQTPPCMLPHGSEDVLNVLRQGLLRSCVLTSNLANHNPVRHAKPHIEAT